MIQCFEQFNNDNDIGKALFVVNKYTKYLRDVKNDYFKYNRFGNLSDILIEYLSINNITIDNMNVDDIIDQQKELYKLKDDVIAKYNPKIVTYHKFKNGDVRPLYKIGKYVFHGQDINEKILGKIKYYKPDIDLDINDAIDILKKYII